MHACYSVIQGSGRVLQGSWQSSISCYLRRCICGFVWPLPLLQQQHQPVSGEPLVLLLRDPTSCVQVYLHLLQEHGLVFGIHQAYLLDYLFCTIAVACAFDFTFQFDWVLDREEWAESITYAKNVSST